MRIKIALAAVLALTALAVGVTLLHSPSTVAATNGIEPEEVIGIITRDRSACQPAETLPAGSSAIRLDIDAPIGPRVAVQAYVGRRLLTRGTLGTGWFGSAVTVPVKPLRRTFSHVTVCFQLRYVGSYLALRGRRAAPTRAMVLDGRRLPGRIGVAYLRGAHKSWWAQARAVIRHMGLGRAASGSWIAFPIAALTATAIALACGVLVRELR
jgi:hypothetical protein